jgi:hypothetical protein
MCAHCVCVCVYVCVCGWACLHVCARSSAYLDSCGSRLDAYIACAIERHTGLVLHQADLPALSDYILANMHRKPPDWLMTEWYKGMTYTAKMAIGNRHRGFTHRLNMFEHIGNHSSFPGREDQGSKDSQSHVNYDIPKCFDANWWLLPAERYNPLCTPLSSLSPCTHEQEQRARK